MKLTKKERALMNESKKLIQELNSEIFKEMDGKDIEKLYNVFHIGDKCGKIDYKITTNDFTKWLEEHSQDRLDNNNAIEEADEFVIKDVFIKIY